MDYQALEAILMQATQMLEEQGKLLMKHEQVMSQLLPAHNALGSEVMRLRARVAELEGKSGPPMPDLLSKRKTPEG